MYGKINDNRIRTSEEVEDINGYLDWVHGVLQEDGVEHGEGVGLGLTRGCRGEQRRVRTRDLACEPAPAQERRLDHNGLRLHGDTLERGQERADQLGHKPEQGRIRAHDDGHWAEHDLEPERVRPDTRDPELEPDGTRVQRSDRFVYERADEFLDLSETDPRDVPINVQTGVGMNPDNLVTEYSSTLYRHKFVRLK